MSTSAVNLNYQSWGSGPPLIILHGLFGSLINWQTISRSLSCQWTVYVLDLRNHGDSPQSADFGYKAMVMDLKLFMDRHRISQANILGHSLGGKVVMAFADHFPELIESLIVVDIVPKPYPSSHINILKALLKLDLNRICTLKDALAGLELAIPSLPLRHFLLKNLVRGKDGKYIWKINLKAIFLHYEGLSLGPQIGNHFPKPALFIRGGASEFILDEDSGLIQRYFPNFHLITVNNASHWLHIDAPEETIRVIAEFLHGVSTPGLEATLSKDF